MPSRFQYVFELPVRPPEVFRAITQENPPSKVFGKSEWSGEPWKAGSERTLEMLYPVHSTHKQKVVAIVPDKLIDVLSHGLGHTKNTQIFLREIGSGTTEVKFLIDIEAGLPLLGMFLGEFVKGFMKVYLEELRERCGVSRGIPLDDPDQSRESSGADQR
jgi:hypothetical protein